MKFAHISQIFSREGETAAERYDLLWRELALCDELNYDFGFTTVHHFSHLRPQVTVFCTGAAARTSRIRLGPIGYTVALHEPIRVVEEVAVLDNITNGRLEIGLTAGVTYDEFRIYGADWDNRHARATEMMYLLKKAFTSEKPLDFEGSFNRYEQVQLSVEPLQKPHPPIWLISLSPDQIKASAKEGVHTGYAHFRPRHEAVPPIKDYLRMWRENGHPYDPNICYMTFVYVDETDEAAAAKAGPNILHSTDAIYGGELGGGGIALADVFEKQGYLERAEIRRHMYDFDYQSERNLVFVGSPDTVVRKIKMAAQEGLFNVFCGEFNIGALPEEDLMRSIRLFGTEVIPALRDFDPIKEYLRPGGGVTT